MLNSLLRLITIFFIVIFLFAPAAVLAEVEVASHTPWSGYWWPTDKGGLVTGIGYRGHPAPLEKYELLTHGSYPHTLSSWYRNNFYDPDAPSWYGHCAAWSKASVLEDYEILPSSENNIIFRVGDKKGLLTLSHQMDLLEVASGNADTFHYWLLHYIKDQDVPFFADLDISLEKWFYPIYKYDMNSTRRGNTESISVTISYVTDNVHPDYMGSLTKYRTYTYDLTLDIYGNITGGEWTNGSMEDHPEILGFPLSQQTDAPELDYSTVKQIAQNRDDFLEQGDAVVPLAPGTYNLVLLDVDTYEITTQIGDSFYLTIEKQDGSSQNMTAVLEDNSGKTLSSVLTEERNIITMRINDLDSPPYLLHISQQEYNDPNIYTLTLDPQKLFMQHMPFLPKNGMWVGYALTNDLDQEVHNIMLTTHNDEGKPLQTILGPLSLAAGEKRVFLFDALPYRLHELSETKGLTLVADDEIQVVNLIGDTKALASQVQNNATADHIVIPVVADTMNSQLLTVGSLRNEGLQDNIITFRSFRSNGTLFSEKKITLTGHQLLPIQSGHEPFRYLPDNGWVEIVSDSEMQLSGFNYLKKKTKESLDGLFALPVNSGTKFIPHVPPEGNWLTTLTLINLSDDDSQLRLHPSIAGMDSSKDMILSLGPHEKRVLSIGQDFGKLPGDPLYHSVVEIDADYEFVGYFTYQEGVDGDDASFSLLDDSHFKSRLTMPHYPGKTNWWTGMVLSNPSSFAQTVFVTAYDNKGELLVDETRELSIPAGGYETFTIVALFPTSADDISFISCRTENDTRIGGLYLYGAKAGNSLSGGVM